MVTERRASMPLKIVILDGTGCDLPMKELRARIGAVLEPAVPPARRRSAKQLPKGLPSKRRMLCFHGIILDLANGIAYLNRTNLNVTRREFDLLEYLIHNSDRYVPLAELAENVWDTKGRWQTNMIENRIHSLRRKFAIAGGDIPIVNLRGVGYALRPPVPAKKRPPVPVKRRKR